jgi:hypothetical protein
MERLAQNHIRGKLTARSFMRGTLAMSRLTIELTEQQHQALKALAALEGKTIRCLRAPVSRRPCQ